MCWSIKWLNDFNELKKQMPLVKEFCHKPVKHSNIAEVINKYYKSNSNEHLIHLTHINFH